MAHDPIIALDQAIDGLERELAVNPRFVLLQNLRSARDAFHQLGSSVRPAVKAADDPERPTGRQMTPARRKALELATDFLAAENGIRKTKDIYSYLELHEVELPGGANNLASLLSRSDLFTSFGRQGWALKRLNLNLTADEDGAETAEQEDPIILHDPTEAGELTLS